MRVRTTCAVIEPRSRFKSIVRPWRPEVHCYIRCGLTDGVRMLHSRRGLGNRGGRAVSFPLKANLILLMVAAIVIELFAVLSTPFLEEIARTEVVQKARIMMEAAAGIRVYTSSEIAPLLNAK